MSLDGGCLSSRLSYCLDLIIFFCLMNLSFLVCYRNHSCMASEYTFWYSFFTRLRLILIEKKNLIQSFYSKTSLINYSVFLLEHLNNKDASTKRSRLSNEWMNTHDIQKLLQLLDGHFPRNPGSLVAQVTNQLKKEKDTFISIVIKK